jgi:predicted MPP superfamily phosphohydrolase
MDVFTYRLTVRNPKILATKKGDKKFPLLFLSFIFYLSFTGRRLKHSSLTAAHSISE